MVLRLNGLRNCQVYHLKEAKGTETRRYPSSTGIIDGKFITPARRKNQKHASIVAQEVSELAGFPILGGARILGTWESYLTVYHC